MSYPRISSPITKVLWAGWESDTLRLQQAGWQLSAEQDIMTAQVRFTFKNPNCRIYGLSNLVSYADYFDSYKDGQFYRQIPPLIIQYMASRMEINIFDNLAKFRSVDTLPNIVEEIQKKDIEDFNIFRPIGNIKELIVTPQSVPELLDLIIQKQDPKQKEIREEKCKKWRKFAREINQAEMIKIEEEIDPRKNIVAQLITI